MSLRTILTDGLPHPPADLARPPLQEIRRRVVRRRRTIRGATAAAVVTAVAAASAVAWATAPRPDRSAPATTNPTASPAPSASGQFPVRDWGMAVLGRDGRTLTFQVSSFTPDQTKCQEISRLDTRQTAERVTVTVYVVQSRFGSEGGCGQNKPGSVVLDAPLGDRPVVDGSDDEPRPVGLMADVPQAPSGFTEAVIGHDGNRLLASYSNGTGPTIEIEGLAPDGSSYRTPVGDPTGTLDVDGHHLTVHDGAGEGCAAQWDAHGLRFTVRLIPFSPDTVTRAECQATLRTLRW